MEHAALMGVDLIFPGAAAMMPTLPPTASRRRQAGGFTDPAGTTGRGRCFLRGLRGLP